MKPELEIDEKARSAYLKISEREIVDQIELSVGVPLILADVDKKGNVVGIEIVGF